MLFVYLIYETAKLSREKIRHQFAVDAAVFVEMTNYSDFLNRTAYVNGAFPMRIFDEGFKETRIDCDGKDVCDNYDCSTKHHCVHETISLWEIMCRNGDFPMAGGTCNPNARTEYGNSDSKWDIRFGGWGADKNSGNPPGLGRDTLAILTMNDANSYWINWDDANQIYKLYVQIYQLLGSVEDAQYSVLQRLAAQHNFLKKSYWLNTGDPIPDAATAARIFSNGVGSWGLGQNVRYLCYQRLNFYGNKPTGSAFQPWQVYAPEHPPVMPQTIAGCDGLFHFMWISPGLTGNLNRLRPGAFQSRGVEVRQPWTAPANYFNHNFNQPAQPAVHVTVAIGGARSEVKPSVWPDPTPKFQVRSYP